MNDLCNETSADAFRRVTDAKIGCLAGATDTFLLALRGYLYEWIEQVNNELTRRMVQHNNRQEAEVEADY